MFFNKATRKLQNLETVRLLASSWTWDKEALALLNAKVDERRKKWLRITLWHTIEQQYLPSPFIGPARGYLPIKDLTSMETLWVWTLSHNTCISLQHLNNTSTRAGATVQETKLQTSSLFLCSIWNLSIQPSKTIRYLGILDFTSRLQTLVPQVMVKALVTIITIQQNYPVCSS